MIIAVLRITLLWLRRAGYDVPTIPTLLVRHSLLERLLTPPPPPRPDGAGHGPAAQPLRHTVARQRRTR